MAIIYDRIVLITTNLKASDSKMSIYHQFGNDKEATPAVVINASKIDGYSYLILG